MATRIQLRSGTAAEWASANTILSAGEPGVELPNGYLKIGDGLTPWSELPYVSEPSGGNQNSSGGIIYQAVMGGPYAESEGRIYLGYDILEGDFPENSLLFRKVT